jgi:hypothetical protein
MHSAFNPTDEFKNWFFSLLQYLRFS